MRHSRVTGGQLFPLEKSPRPMKAGIGSNYASRWIDKINAITAGITDGDQSILFHYQTSQKGTCIGNGSNNIADAG